MGQRESTELPYSGAQLSANTYRMPSALASSDSGRLRLEDPLRTGTRARAGAVLARTTGPGVVGSHETLARPAPPCPP